jgi:hypothetical protein
VAIYLGGAQRLPTADAGWCTTWWAAQSLPSAAMNVISASSSGVLTRPGASRWSTAASALGVR